MPRCITSRRERRCELIAEGFRKMDIYRWRSLDRMKEYHIEGFNLWDEEYKSYVNASGQSLLVVEGRSWSSSRQNQRIEKVGKIPSSNGGQSQ